MFRGRRSPLLGAAVVYGASRSGARRGMQVEAERQAAMESQALQNQAAYEAQRDRENQRKAESDKQKQEALEKEKELARKEAELEAREKQLNRPDNRYLAPPAYGGLDVLFCTRCGNQCKVGDKFCGGCGTKLPLPEELVK